MRYPQQTLSKAQKKMKKMKKTPKMRKKEGLVCTNANWMSLLQGAPKLGLQQKRNLSIHEYRSAQLLESVSFHPALISFASDGHID